MKEDFVYRALMTPHLEFSAEFWFPGLKTDFVVFEAVQRRLARLKEIPEKVVLLTVEFRGMRDDLI